MDYNSLQSAAAKAMEERRAYLEESNSKRDPTLSSGMLSPSRVMALTDPYQSRQGAFFYDTDCFIAKYSGLTQHKSLSVRLPPNRLAV